MTRRDLLWAGALAATAGPAPLAPLTVPLRRLTDKRASSTMEQLRRFRSDIWAEAERDFKRCGIEFQMTDGTGEIKRSPGSRPIFAGLERGAINMVLTDHVPQDYGAVAGVTTLHEGYHLCVIALAYAHGHQVPYLSVNTCVHELLHAFLQDIFVSRPKWYQAGEREIRADWYATRMWLFQDGAVVRKAAEAYVRRLRA